MGSDERCGCAPCQGCSLTDLEAMRAEVAGLRADVEEWRTSSGYQLMRREQAQVEVHRLRAELADMTALAESENARGGNAREAIARVRAVLTDRQQRWYDPEQDDGVLLDRVLRALDGGTE